ncbi:MAG: VOC family protein [Pseudomonadota bacterium]
MTTPHGYFHWNELGTTDVETAKKIYAEAAGWTFNSMDMDDGTTYWVAMDGETPICGLFTMPPEMAADVPEHWIAYISIDDVDAAVDKAKAHGMTLMRDIFDVDGVGRIAMLKQPDGAMIGWMTPAEEG